MIGTGKASAAGDIGLFPRDHKVCWNWMVFREASMRTEMSTVCMCLASDSVLITSQHSGTI
jgi:hypothetical protein